MTQCLCCPGEYDSVYCVVQESHDSVFVLSRKVLTQCLCCPGES